MNIFMLGLLQVTYFLVNHASVSILLDILY
jgi:hypothetical protein